MKTEVLSFELAHRIANGALEAAKLQDLAIAVSLVDGGGHLVCFARQDGVSHLALDVTLRKARTANGFKMPSHNLAQVAQFDANAGADIAKNSEICTVEGGLPISVNGICVGGLGIGGGTSAQDLEIAKLALAAGTSEKP